MRLYVCVLAALLSAQSAPATALAGAAPPLVRKVDKTLTVGSPLPAWAQPLAEIAPTSRRDPVVFRLRETQSWVGPVPATLINQAIQVNDPSALAAIGQFSIDYHPAYQKLSLHRIAILRGGQVLDRAGRANIRVLQQERELQGGVYGGAQTVQLLLDDVRVGDTLWISYTTEGRNPVFGKPWADDFSWDIGAPVELRRVSVLHPRGRPLHWRQLGDFQASALTPVIEQAGDIERIRFEGKGLEGVEPEPSIPADYLPARMIQMSEHDSWKSVAGWAAELFPAAAPTPALRQLARQFAGQPDKAAQAAAALHWVQDEIRYFSVSIGENSHRPQAPDVVLQRRYGDCKDKAYLLASVLGQLGIAARPVLVNAQAPGLPAKVMPSPTWFDHVIVRIELDGNIHYVDPTRTGQKGALARLPLPFPEAPGLVADAGTDGLTVLPRRKDSLPEYEHVDRIVIAAFDGDALLESRDVYRGDHADAARRRIPAASANEMKKELLGRYEKRYPGLSLAEPPRFEDKVEDGSFEVLARFKLPKPVEHADGKYRLDYASQVMDGTLGIPDNLTRQFPFAYPRGKVQARYRLRVVWPETVRHAGAAQAKTIDNPYLRMREEYTFRSNYLDYVLDYRLKSDRIAASDLPGLQQQVKLLAPYVEASFRIGEEALVKQAAAVSLRDVEVARTQAALAAWREAYAARKDKGLNGDERCDLLAGLAVMREIDLPDSAVAMRGMMGVLREDARPEAWACLGGILFMRGDFGGSIAALERAKLDDGDDALATLAWARLHAGDARGAAADMLRLLRAQSAAGRLRALDIAEAAALLRRTGGALPPEFAAPARELPDGPWPRPLLALQAGTLEPEALLALAEAQPGDARDLALDEAWFYIAQQRLAGGDRRGARLALQRVRAHAVIGSRLHGRALAELAALEPADPDYRAGNALLDKEDRKGAAQAWTRAAQRGVAEAQYKLAIAYHYGDAVKEDQVAAAHWFQLAAAQDHAGACNMVGLYLSSGFGGMAVDTAGANKWYRCGAEFGNEVAALNLGRHYLDGTGIELDRAQGMRWLLQAAELNDLEAQSLVAQAYSDGEGVVRDDAAAAYWASRAAMRGSDEGRVLLGRILWDGHGTGKDPAMGSALIRQAAMNGNVTGWYFMGEAYEYGRGVEASASLAFGWYQKAALAGHQFAALKLGRAYLHGRGVMQDKKLAAKWLNRAGESTSIQINMILATLYETGEGGLADPARAGLHYRKAAEAGNIGGQWRLARMLRDGRGVAADPVQAAAWMRKAAEARGAQAQTDLARMYQAGIGVERDDAKALDWYRHAARGGECQAMEGLGAMYESGKGVPADLRMAQVYYALAARNPIEPGECAGAAARAEQLAGRLDAVQLASAQASVQAWKTPQPLPDETPETAAVH